MFFLQVGGKIKKKLNCPTKQYTECCLINKKIELTRTMWPVEMSMLDVTGSSLLKRHGRSIYF